MPFVDTDFILALIKNEDWLKENAKNIYQRYKNNLWTSGFAIAELLLISKRLELDCEIIIANVYMLIEVRGLEMETAVLAAHYMKKYKTNAFDALQAAVAKDDLIISSDGVYDEIGLNRLKLEK